MNFNKIIDPNNKNVKHDDLRFYLFSSHLYFLCLLIHILLLIVFLFLEIRFMAVFNVFSCLIFVSNLIINKKGHLSLAYHLAIVEISLHGSLATICIGWGSNFSFYAIAVCSVIMFTSFLKIKKKIMEVIATSVMYIIAYLYTVNFTTLYKVDKDIVDIIGFFNIVIMMTILTSIFYKFYLETKLLNEKLKTVAETDGLTGIYNRRYFNEYINFEINKVLNRSKCRKNVDRKITIGIAIIDIDNFKNINDTYGHIVGDSVIIQVVEVIKRNLVSNELMCRYGGEEFVVLFTETPKNDAVKVAEKMRMAVEESRFDFSEENRSGMVTVSIGFAYFEEKISENINCLLKLADDRLYEAKKTGKNKVIYQ